MVRKKSLQNLIRKLNILRGKRKCWKKHTMVEKKSKSRKTNLFHMKVDKILSEHRSFFKIKPISPIYSPCNNFAINETTIKCGKKHTMMEKISKSQVKLFHTKVAKILSEHKNFSKIKPISPIYSPCSDFSIDEKIIQDILLQHRQFQKLIPISFLTSPEKKTIHLNQRFETDETFFKGHHFTSLRTPEETLADIRKIKICSLHSTNRPSKPCIDCFFLNYFNSEFDSGYELSISTFHLKNEIFSPIIDDLDFNVFPENDIQNTELPLFDSNDEFKLLDFTVSCHRHIFTPPHDRPCDNCFWLNYLKH